MESNREKKRKQLVRDRAGRTVLSRKSFKSFFLLSLNRNGN